MTNIKTALARFRALVQAPPAGVQVEEAVDDAFVWHPMDSKPVQDREIGLMLMGLTHGNEHGGLGVLIRVLEHLRAGTIKMEGSMAFVLGNVPAAEANRRFIESDLNRSFDVAQPSTQEQLRAAALMPLLQRTAFMVDFHQTLRESATPFFIFPYEVAGYSWARRLHSALPIVTHWGEPFSKEGQCTDEYLNGKGGTGISIELGQNGFDPYQIAVGTDIALAAIGTTWGDGRPEDPAPAPPGPIYTWEDIVPWPEPGLVTLQPGFENFTTVTKDQVIGSVGNKEIRAPSAGPVLFPKYLSAAQQKELPQTPTELMRILKQVTPDALPS